MCQYVYTHQAGRTPALQQNSHSSEKLQHFKEKTQYLMNTLYIWQLRQFSCCINLAFLPSSRFCAVYISPLQRIYVLFSPSVKNAKQVNNFKRLPRVLNIKVNFSILLKLVAKVKFGTKLKVVKEEENFPFTEIVSNFKDKQVLR